MPAETLEVDGHTINLDSPDKVLFPDDKINKKDLVRYYEHVSPFMVPHVKDRPLTLNRFPNGINGEGFYQKEISSYFPSWMHRTTEKKIGGTTTYVVCNDAASLVYLAGQACITMHVWLSCEDKPDNPDMLIFDLDPPDSDFEPVRHAAFFIRDFLGKIGASAFVKTTGSRGLHVVIPLDRSAAFNDVRLFAQDIARFLAGRDPEHLTVEERKEKRGNRIFLDTLRNSYAQTAVAPYSVRALPKAPVAAPLTWEELGNRDTTVRRYNISNIMERLEKTGDPWRNMWDKTYGLNSLKKGFEALKV